MGRSRGFPAISLLTSAPARAITRCGFRYPSKSSRAWRSAPDPRHAGRGLHSDGRPHRALLFDEALHRPSFARLQGTLTGGYLSGLATACGVPNTLGQSASAKGEKYARQPTLTLPYCRPHGRRLRARLVLTRREMNSLFRDVLRGHMPATAPYVTGKEFAMRPG